MMSRSTIGQSANRERWGTIRTLIGILVLGLLAPGCSTGASSDDPNGTLNIRAKLDSAAAAKVVKVVVHVKDTPTGLIDMLEQELLLDAGTKTFKGSLSVPAGERKIVAVARDQDDKEVGKGEVTVSIPETGSVDVTVNIILPKAVPDNVTQNFGPVITAIVITNPETGSTTDYVAKNQKIQLEVMAHDPENDPLTYEWTAIAVAVVNKGTFSPPAAAKTEWSTPSGSIGPLGLPISFKVVVSDGELSTDLTSDTITLRNEVGNSNVSIGFLPSPDSLKVTLELPGHKIYSPVTCVVNADPATDATCKQTVTAGEKIKVKVSTTLKEGNPTFRLADSCGGAIEHKPSPIDKNQWEWTTASVSTSKFCILTTTIEVTGENGVKQSGSLEAAIWTKKAP